MEIEARNIKKAAKIAACVLVILLLIVIIPMQLRRSRYNAALRLFESAAYSQSVGKWSELGDYKDSFSYFLYALMKTNIEKEEFESARANAVKAGNFLDAPQYAMYFEALELMEKNEYEQAISMLESAGDILDAMENREYCVEIYERQLYEAAIEHMENKEWLSAYELLDRVAYRYPGGAVLANECMDNWLLEEYYRALTLIFRGDSEATAVLRSLNDYRDSSELLAYCEDGEKGFAYAALLLTPVNDPGEHAAGYAELGDYRDAAAIAAEYRAQANGIN